MPIKDFGRPLLRKNVALACTQPAVLLLKETHLSGTLSSRIDVGPSHREFTSLLGQGVAVTEASFVGRMEGVKCISLLGGRSVDIWSVTVPPVGMTIILQIHKTQRRGYATFIISAPIVFL